MGMKRLTYDAKGKHYCDYSTREIINRLAECEIMLEKIQNIAEQLKGLSIDEMSYVELRIKEILDGNDK